MADLKDVVPILSLTEEERRAIVLHMRVRRFDVGEPLYGQGDPGRDLFVVHSGRVEVVLEGGDDEELLLGEYGRGQFLGEIELLRQTAGRLTTVRATEPGIALQIAQAEALRVLRQNPAATYFIGCRVSELYGRLRYATAALAFADAQSRVADALLELHTPGERSVLGLTQAKVAAAAGVRGPPLPTDPGGLREARAHRRARASPHPRARPDPPGDRDSGRPTRRDSVGLRASLRRCRRSRPIAEHAPRVAKGPPRGRPFGLTPRASPRLLQRT
jgi:CRP/FNR family cyclic AMP-dependent transcriptional regulator